MSRLDRSLHPHLTQDVIDKLFEREIYTVLSFVKTDPEVLVRLTGLNYSVVLIIRNAILAKFSSPYVTGYQLYNNLINHCAIISTGINELDRLLDGGFVTGNIYEICGGVGCGKTQLCMTVSVHLTKTLKDDVVVYVDTKNDFSGRRIGEIAVSGSVQIDDPAILINRIKIFRILNVRDLLSFLHQLSKELKEIERQNFRIVIIDSLSVLFFQFMGKDWREGLALMNNLASLLHYVAVEYNIVILVTNLTTNWVMDTCDENDEGDDEESVADKRGDVNDVLDDVGGFDDDEIPLLGEFWSHVPNTRINMEKLEDSNRCVLEITKSCEQATGRIANVSITNAGVV